MKSDNIARQYDRIYVPGNSAFKAINTFGGTILMEIPDIITIDNSVINFKTSALGDQISLSSDGINHAYSGTTLKSSIRQNKKIQWLDDNYDLDWKFYNRPKPHTYLWTINVPHLIILENWLLYKIKQERSFEGMLGINTPAKNKKIDTFILQFLKNDIIPRLKLDKVKFYVKYYPVFDGINTGYSQDALLKSNETKSFKVSGDMNSKDLTIEYLQENLPYQYTFHYYYDLVYTKI